MIINIKRNKPFYFKLFATTWNVVWDNKRMNDKLRYGEADYSQSKITLSTSNGTEELSDDRIKDCFYHEKVHAILDTMQEYEKSKDEKFVDQFAKLLRQSDETLTLK
jgi:hypothetical protein